MVKPLAVGFAVGFGAELTMLAVLRPLVDVETGRSNAIVWVMAISVVLSVLVALAGVRLKTGRLDPASLVLSALCEPIVLIVGTFVLWAVAYNLACAGIQTPFVRGSCN